MQNLSNGDTKFSVRVVTDKRFDERPGGWFFRNDDILWRLSGLHFRHNNDNDDDDDDNIEVTTFSSSS